MLVQYMRHSRHGIMHWNFIIVITPIFLSLAFAINNDDSITQGPPVYDKPWVPAWGYNRSDSNLWKKHHDHMVKQSIDNKDLVKVMFFGDSKIYYWSVVGKESWNKYYASRGAFNYGIRGDSTRQVLWRLENNELDDINPKLLIFCIGGNNLKKNYNQGTDEEIVTAIILILKEFELKLPNTKIIIIGQLPRKESTIMRAQHINELLKERLDENDDDFITFCNFYNSFINSDGSQNTGLFVKDKIHLNAEGYKILTELLEPYVKKILDEN